YNETILAKGEFEMYLGTPLLVPSANADLLGRHHSKGNGNIFKFSDPQLDQMIERQAALSRDPDVRKKLLQDIQRTIIDRAYLLTVQAGYTSWILWPWVKDLYLPGVTGSAEYDQFTTVWLDK